MQLSSLGGKGVSYRFLLDENVPRTIFKMLRQKGFHTEYVPQGVDDRTVIEIAREMT